jgi:DNA-binding response OmpR family regulator
MADTDKKKILVVDDEPDIVRLVDISLKLCNFEVQSAYSGAEALEKLKEGKPDLLLLDVMMPKMSGYEVCAAIRKDPALKDLPIIMLTAKGQKGDAEKGLESGADDYIIKPFDPYDLGERVSRFLQKE